MADGFKVTVLDYLFFSFLLSRAPRRLADSLAPRSAPLLRAPLLVCLSLGTVAGDGAPRSLSVVRSSGVCWTRPISFSDSSLAGLRPFSLPMFHPAHAPGVAFCGYSLSLAVLAGLLPQLTTYYHCFTFVDFQATPLSLQ